MGVCSCCLPCLQGGATGRLLVFDPSTRQTEVLSEGFWFANGVALSPDGTFVAVVETTSMRVHRYWLAGPKVRLFASLSHLLTSTCSCSRG